MMKQRSANILLAGKREIRAINDPCDPSCFMWFACGNSKPNDVCKGFVLLNGESRKLINRNLTEDDVLYVETCVRMVQNGAPPEQREHLIQEVLRYIPPQPTRHREGFLGMLEASTRNIEEEKTQSQRMVEASRKNTEQPIVRQRQPWDFEYNLPQICDDGCFAKRVCSSYPRNVGNPCVKRWEQYKNR